MDMVCPFISAGVAKVTGFIEDAELTKVNTIYSELLLEIYFIRSKRNPDFKACMS